MGVMRSWDVRFVQSFNDRELDLVSSFLQLLEFHIPISEGGAQVRWKLKRMRIFDIHSFYNVLRGSNAF